MWLILWLNQTLSNEPSISFKTAIFVGWGDMDIPVKFQDTENYVATTAHKMNHRYDDNDDHDDHDDLQLLLQLRVLRPRPPYLRLHPLHSHHQARAGRAGAVCALPLCPGWLSPVVWGPLQHIVIYIGAVRTLPLRPGLLSPVVWGPLQHIVNQDNRYINYFFIQFDRTILRNKRNK